MFRHSQTKLPLLMRLSASLGAALVFMLAVLAVSPALHTWLHSEISDTHNPTTPTQHHGSDEGCVVTQFSQGSSELAVAPALLPAQPLALVGNTPLSVFCAPGAPAHLLPPGCGPPLV